MTQNPQPHTDIELGKLCRWLVRHSYTCTVNLAGDLKLTKRPYDPYPSHYRRSIERRSQGMALISK